ncbi:ATP-binding protein [Aquabacterium sp.]|uniref:sensor histidine kinase n=1 Tax=Aquabacterium sp. TaxID=1872578 RepID=UPI003D0427B1
MVTGASHPPDTPPGPLDTPQTPYPDDRALAHDSARLVYRQTSAALMGHFLGVVVTTLVYWEHVPQPWLWAWSAAFALLWVARFVNLLSYERAVRQGPIDAQRWLRSWNTGALIGASLWSVAAVLFYHHGGHFERTALMLTVYSFAIGAVPYMSSQPRLFLACMGLYFIPMIVHTAQLGGSDNLYLAGIWSLMCLCTLAMGRAFHNMFGEMVSLRLHTQQLAQRLRAEMTAAESAQHQAELANRAKTQFFAAASHDLRQPLHALGLFAEALRQRCKDDEVAHLVHSINSSVDALEGLFSELLDITKIDTGGIDIQPEHIPLRGLFERLRLTFEPTAFEKGLSLRFHGARHHVYADPLVVERILRNLISNAIRYTEDGGVLVSCRPRGDHLCLQVWDSGIGILPKEQERIFEEFYQTQSKRPLEPHHRKGLGLGLAIVKRLAKLMDAPLTLRSRVGHGTVFTVLLPVGKAVRAPVADTPPRARTPLTLDRRHIVVVEDEPAVAEGLEILLKGWGATVSAFDTLDAVAAWAAHTEVPPDLLIADYRLPEQRTGIEVIHLMRAHFGAALPVIMVTGSTMSGHETEARSEDFHLLLKPVIPTRLRALIAFKLGQR